MVRLIADKAARDSTGLQTGGTMKKPLLLVMLLAVAGAGCAAMSLERHAASQIQSAADYRYQATLHALAMVAADPGTLPSYALLSSGVASVSNTDVANSATTWSWAPAILFKSQALVVTGAHAPQGSWSVDPVADYTQLEAMRCACRWVLAGPEQVDPNCIHVLADPEMDLSPGPHFGVIGRLARLPRGWLHVGRLCDVPRCACCKDHCGDTWAWVVPEGMEGLAEFTLVLQDIVTLDVAPSDGTRPANVTPPLLVTLWVYQDTLPNVVFIDIVRTGNTAMFLKEGATGPMDVAIGQSVIWRNFDETSAHTVFVRKDDKTTFSRPIQKYISQTLVPSSAPIVFDQDMYKNAGGADNRPALISVTDDKIEPGKIRLVAANPWYSPTLAFRVDRVIRPECRCMIEQKMKEGISSNQVVQISWCEWMQWTTPYQGQRTSVKPGTPKTPSSTQPLNRAAPPNVINSQGIRMGPTLRNLTPIENPFSYLLRN
ncbi:MAG: hypothetical protein ABSF26_05290 [Thermoguttaceae bacterium]